MDIRKRHTYFDFENSTAIPIQKAPYSTESGSWVQWVCIATPKTCGYCASQHGRILSPVNPNIIWPPVHDHCRCLIFDVIALPAGTVTEDGMEGVDYYLFTHGSLPSNYMTQSEAHLLGWSPREDNLWEISPGATIGGSRYWNLDYSLPDKPGRVWYETDFDYDGGTRNAKRIIFSNDGLVFVTFDHYLTFSEVKWEVGWEAADQDEEEESDDDLHD